MKISLTTAYSITNVSTVVFCPRTEQTGCKPG